MNTNTKRMVLVAIAAFYVVVGGLFLQAYIPVQRFNASVEGPSLSGNQKAFEQQMRDALSYPDNQAKVRRYGSILLWGSLALGAGGGVLFLTRGRKSQPAQTGAQ